jgi:hypothetical protein
MICKDFIGRQLTKKRRWVVGLRKRAEAEIMRAGKPSRIKTIVPRRVVFKFKLTKRRRRKLDGGK